MFEDAYGIIRSENNSFGFNVTCEEYYLGFTAGQVGLGLAWCCNLGFSVRKSKRLEPYPIGNLQILGFADDLDLMGCCRSP